MCTANTVQADTHTHAHTAEHAESNGSNQNRVTKKTKKKTLFQLLKMYVILFMNI